MNKQRIQQLAGILLNEAKSDEKAEWAKLNDWFATECIPHFVKDIKRVCSSLDVTVKAKVIKDPDYSDQKALEVVFIYDEEQTKICYSTERDKVYVSFLDAPSEDRIPEPFANDLTGTAKDFKMLSSSIFPKNGGYDRWFKSSRQDWNYKGELNKMAVKDDALYNKGDLVAVETKGKEPSFCFYIVGANDYYQVHDNQYYANKPQEDEEFIPKGKEPIYNIYHYTIVGDDTMKILIDYINGDTELENGQVRGPWYLVKKPSKAYFNKRSEIFDEWYKALPSKIRNKIV